MLRTSTSLPERLDGALARERLVMVSNITYPHANLKARSRTCLLKSPL